MALRLPDGRTLRGVMHDYSNDGVGLELAHAPERGLVAGTRVSLLLGRGRREFAFAAVVQRSVGARLGLLLRFESEAQRVEFVQCTFARADAWLNWHAGYRPMSSPRSLWSVLKLGWQGYRRMGDFGAPSISTGRCTGAAMRCAGWPVTRRNVHFFSYPADPAADPGLRP